MMLNNLMSRTVAVHVRYNSVSVHMPSSALTVEILEYCEIRRYNRNSFFNRPCPRRRNDFNKQ